MYIIELPVYLPQNIMDSRMDDPPETHNQAKWQKGLVVHTNNATLLTHLFTCNWHISPVVTRPIIWTKYSHICREPCSLPSLGCILLTNGGAVKGSPRFSRRLWDRHAFHYLSTEQFDSPGPARVELQADVNLNIRAQVVNMHAWP
jgi:hypothetical protein